MGNVWFFVHLIHRPMRTKNQLYKNPKHSLTPEFLIPLTIIEIIPPLPNFYIAGGAKPLQIAQSSLPSLPSKLIKLDMFL